MMRTAHLAGIGHAVPHPYTTERFIEVDREMRRRHGQPPAVHEMAARFARNTGIARRHTMHPFLHQVPAVAEPDIMGDADYDPEFWQRMAFYDRSLELAVAAAREAVACWGGAPATISHLIATGTSGWREPGIASAVIEGLALGLDTAKAELNFNGCFAGATCLRLARDAVRAGESGAVLVVALEAASTLFDFTDTQVSTLLANALFGDGAAAVVVAPEGGWRFERAGMTLVPQTRHMLRFAPPTAPGRTTYEMFLHREIGARLAHFLRNERGAELLDDLLRSCGEPPALAIHPGGPGILEAVQDVFVARGWPADCLATSFATLRDFGNMGSAAMLFALERTLPRVQGDHLATLAFGPGVTVEWGIYSRA
jgi:predicted naringenin-chalcone synthase